MSQTLLKNVKIFDGTGAALFPGEVLIDGEQIAAVTRAASPTPPPGTRVIDGEGATLMPGLVEGHAHLTYPYSVTRVPRPGLSIMDVVTGKFPIEERAFMAAYNAKVLLDAGFTSAYSAGGATQTMELALRREIDAGHIPGPRFRASGTEGAFLPEQDMSAALRAGELAAAEADHRAQTAEAMRRYVKESAELGVNVVKIFLSGPAPAGPHDNQPMYHDEVLAAAGTQAKASGVWLTGHARPAAAIKQGLRYGFRVLYHCDHLDEETLDLMEQRRDEVFIGPSIGGPAALIEARAKAPPERRAAIDDELIPGLNYEVELERQARNCQAMRKRGIRLVIGGDYGFTYIPHGANANDLAYFVKYMGLSPQDALLSATKWGGELMGAGEKLGQVKEGYLADLLLVEGDPLRNISLLSDSKNLRMIMKNGVLHKDATG